MEKMRGIEMFQEGSRWHWRIVEWHTNEPNASKVLVRGSCGEYQQAVDAAKSDYDTESHPHGLLRVLPSSKET